MNAKSFHLGDVLSITTGLLVSPRHMEGIYDILNFMTGDDLYTHQLPRATGECRPILLRQHPQLAEVAVPTLTPETWEGWLLEKEACFGSFLDVLPLAAGEYLAIDPIKELEAMVGEEKVIVVALEAGV